MESTRYPPDGTLVGRHLMTGDFTGYRYRPSVGGAPAWVELSTGFGLRNERIWGVTFRRPGGARLNPDPSTCFHSRAEAEEHARTGGAA